MILERLQDLYSGVTDFDLSVVGGTVQVFLTEGDFSIPATRLSDGTLRYFCLNRPGAAAPDLHRRAGTGAPSGHPPKAGRSHGRSVHSDAVIVTTHSDILVDCMTETPEAVVVCSKEQGQTRMERLNPDGLRVWLDKYRLGELWTSGQIGGTRW